MSDKINLLVEEYIEKRLSTKRTPYRAAANEKVEKIKKEMGGMVEDLTKEYFQKSENPTLLGWERFCLLNKG